MSVKDSTPVARGVAAVACQPNLGCFLFLELRIGMGLGFLRGRGKTRMFCDKCKFYEIQISVSTKKILLKRGARSFLFASRLRNGCFHSRVAESSSWDRDCTSLKT